MSQFATRDNCFLWVNTTRTAIDGQLFRLNTICSYVNVALTFPNHALISFKDLRKN
jgi:hypothetical protein